MTWDAFISYSHAADGKLAPALQSGLQRFMRPWYRRRALRIFRDETGLTVDPRLWTSIADALDKSGCFILLASPEAAKSQWVDREIQHWLAKESVDRLLPVVTDGEWVWKAAAGDFDWERSTAVPAVLRGVFDEEPRHLDLRWAREAERLDLRNPRFLDAIAELAAPMHGKAKDELVGEDIRLYRRARRLAWGAITGLIALTIAAVVGWVFAEHRQVTAESQRLAVQSRQLSGQPDLAFLLAAAAYRMRPKIPETAGAVSVAVQAVPELRRMVRHHVLPVRSVALVPEREVILSGDVDGHVLATSRRTNEILARYDHPLKGVVTCLLPDLEREVVWVVTTGGLVQLGLPDLKPRGVQLASPQPLVKCARDPKRPRIALAGMDGAILIWDLEHDRLVPMLSADEATAKALSFSPDGQYLAFGGKRGAINLRSATDGRVLWSVPEAQRGDILSLAFRPDGAELASGDTDGWIRTWRVKDGVPEADRHRQAHAGAVWDVGYSRGHPSGEYIGSVGTDGEIAWVEAKSFLPYSPTRVHLGRVNALDFADDGTYTTAGEDGVIAYFDPHRPPAMAGRDLPLGQPISLLALAPGGDLVAVAYGRAGTVQLYNPSALKPTGTAMEAGAVVLAAAYQPDGRSLALGTADGRILIWPLAGEAREIRDAHQGPIVALGWSTDGKLLFSLGDDRQLRQWQVAEGRTSNPRPLDELASKALAINPAGDKMAYGHLEDGVRVVETRSGRCLARLQVGRGIATTALAFHPVKPLLFVGDAYGHLSVWETRGWTLQHGPTRGHQGEIAAIAVARDDDRVFTSGRDGTLRLWSATSGEALGVPIGGHGGPVRSLAYDPSTQQVVSGGPDGRLVVRSMDAKRWIDEGCSIFTRTLLPAEYSRFQLSIDDSGPCTGFPPAVSN